MRERFELSGTELHLLAMTFMLLDHLWATVLPAQEWMTCVGRIAFPIFAFMAAEGYTHTHSFKRYMLRLFCFALLSEIPFDLMCNGLVFYPMHQNVLWTLMLGLLGIRCIDAAERRDRKWLRIAVSCLVLLFGFILGTVCMVDYYGAGVVTVLVFYIFRERKWWCLLGQLGFLYWLNVQVLGGQVYPIHVLGAELELSQQGLALLALIPIWLYRGRQGWHNRAFQYACYAFYPVHMLILALLMLLVP